MYKPGVKEGFQDASVSSPVKGGGQDPFPRTVNSQTADYSALEKLLFYKPSVLTIVCSLFPHPLPPGEEILIWFCHLQTDELGKIT